MHLARVFLNPARRACRHLVSSPQRMHAAVLASFPPGTEVAGERGRVLWRLDRLAGNRLALMIAAPMAPDPAAIAEQAGWVTEGGVTVRRMDRLLDLLEEGQQWSFRVTVNPTFRKADQLNASGRPQVLAHVTVAQQTQWLLSRTQTHGFRVPLANETSRDVAMIGDGGEQVSPDDSPLVSLVDRRIERFRRNDAVVTLQTATFEGSLVVTDPAALRRALSHGIGRGKGYGCGLLTLAQP